MFPARMPQQDAEKFSGDQVPKYAREMAACLAERDHHQRMWRALFFALGSLLSTGAALLWPAAYLAGVFAITGLVTAAVFAVLRLRRTVELIQIAAYQRVKIVDPKPDDEVVVLNAPPKNGKSSKQTEAQP